MRSCCGVLFWGLVLFGLGQFIGCSSGLGTPPAPPLRLGIPNPNLQTGFHLPFVLTDPLTDLDACGAFVPNVAGDRNIVFYAFATAAAADNANGSGAALDSSGVTDNNADLDVFLAAVVAERIDTRAFSYSLLSKFRHRRCVTCHNFAAPDAEAFRSPSGSYRDGGDARHPGGLNGPVPEIDSFDEGFCELCHIKTWRAPPTPDFDFRTKSIDQLALRAYNSDPQHFITDKRVLWALDSAKTNAAFGNGAADDDHDGIAEPEDTDRVRRPTPGAFLDANGVLVKSSTVFMKQIDDFRKTVPPLIDTRDAVAQIVAVSRRDTVAATGSGASHSPSVCYVPDPAYDPMITGVDQVAGRVFIAFVSTSTNLVSGILDPAGESVYRAVVDVVVKANGSLALAVQPAQLSSVSNSMTPGQAAGGNSNEPDISSDGRWVAFASDSLDLDVAGGYVSNNGAAERDVFVRDMQVAPAGVRLASAASGGSTIGGNAESSRPAVAVGTGGEVVVAFDSTASDLVAGDQNALGDVFFARVDGGLGTRRRASIATDGSEGIGGVSRAADVFVQPSGEIRIAFQSAMTNLAGDIGHYYVNNPEGASGPVATNVYLHRYDPVGNTGQTDSIGRVRTADGAIVSANHDSFAPAFGASGDRLLFVSRARNLDDIRVDDENYSSDVFLADLSPLDAGGLVPRHRRVSITPDGADADMDSLGVVGGALVAPAGSAGSNLAEGFVAFRTLAHNLGAADTSSPEGSPFVVFQAPLQ